MGFVQNLGVKIVSFVLFVVLVFAICMSTVCFYVLAESNVFIDGGQKLLDGMYEEYSYNRIGMVENLLHDKLGGYNRYSYDEELSPRYTNFRYKALDEQGNIQSSNLNEAEELYREYTTRIKCFVPADQTVNIHYYTHTQSDLSDYIAEFEAGGRQVTSIEEVEFFEQNEGARQYKVKIRYLTGEYKYIEITFGVAKELPVKDIFYYGVKFVDYIIEIKYYLIGFAALALLVCIILFVILMCGAGHKKGVQGIYLCKFNRIPLDLYIALNLGIAYLGIVAVDVLWDSMIGGIICWCVGIPLLTTMVLGFFVTLAARLKTDAWYKNNITYYAVRLVCKIIKTLYELAVKVISKVPLFYKTLLLIVGISFVEFVFLSFGRDEFLLLWIIERLTLVPAVIYCVLCMRGLKHSAEKIAGGDTSHKVNTKYMIFDFKDHGETLNGIGKGLEVAVEKSVKSERMKAELITNVSHDIKTPLTSIINYVDLLKKEGTESENAKEYLDVLDRQSARLKRLTEALVEASKASTGNITMSIEETDMGVLLTQAMGEYEEKMKERGLIPMLTVAEETLTARADGRHLWRVFDNLLNNICKYAQSGTRVYVSASGIDKGVEVVFKNISREPLNIAPDELTERFVRGDLSRNTEGSGLGLSIAKSMTELQGGRFITDIDGDLFKVTVIIPKE